MKGWLLMTLAALTGAGCGTTTAVGSVADDGAQRWFAESASSDANGETADYGPDQPGVVIQATSPTDVQIRSENEDVVALIVPPRRATAVNHRSRALEGILLGVGMGALTGVLLGAPGVDCDPPSACRNSVALGASLLGVVGLVVGSAVGAAIERRQTRRPTR